jgi:hypothetical protein
MKYGLASFFCLVSSVVFSEPQFDMGADLRVRHEMYDNIPGNPNGGILLNSARSKYTGHMRFRPRVWGEVKFGQDNTWRIFGRVVDELRWYIKPDKDTHTFPGELLLDNLFIEAHSLFDGFVDFSFGRQDIYGLYGLDHIFADGTPGDGSRSLFSDVARMTFNFTDESKLDVFFLYNNDDNIIRCGTERSSHICMTGLGGGAEPEMDDMGYGAVYSSKVLDDVDYQIFAIEKYTRAYHRKGIKYPSARRDLIGFKVVPKLTENLSLQVEAMGQIGKKDSGEHISAWSSYLGANWKGEIDSLKPFLKVGLHMMSGDKNAADEEGGNHAWDPMWSRAANDSDMFLYGTHYAQAWWSNMMLLKISGGIDFGGKRKLTLSSAPVFAHRRDGVGGGDGNFKGLLSQARFEFPILVADKKAGERLEISSHISGELFNPGDYYETDKPGWFARWQVDFRF